MLRLPRTPPQTPLGTGLEALNLFGLLAGVLLLLTSWPNPPDRVPGHYDAAGNVTRYDPKSSLWGLVEVNTGRYGLLSAINLFPQLWNLPTHSPADRPRHFRLARASVCCLKAFVMWLFTLILWTDIRVAQGAASGLPWWFLPLGPFAPLAMTAGWRYLAHRYPAYRNPHGDAE